MFAVTTDIADKYFSAKINKDSTTMIGDTWHDEETIKALVA